MSPEELKPLRAELRSKLVARLLEGQKRAIATGETVNSFTVTPVGEYCYGSATGTLTELMKAGICGACLNNKAEECQFCKGTGDHTP